MRNRRRKQRGSTRYFILFIFASILLYSIWFGLTLILKNIDYFKIKNIEIEGTKNLDQAFLKNLSKDYIGVNQFRISKRDVARKYENIVRVKHVKVRRKLPSTLKIIITERIGFLYVKTIEGDFFPIDNELVVLDKADFYFSEDIPLVSLNIPKTVVHLGEKLRTQTLNSIMSLHNKIYKIDKNFISNISEYYVKDKEIYFVDSHSGCRVILGEKDIDKKIKRYIFLRSNKGFKKNSIVDLRYSNQIIVRD